MRAIFSVPPSVFVKVQEDGKEKKIVFSGDLGNIPSPFINGTEYVEETDYALIESAYGDRVHELFGSKKRIGGRYNRGNREGAAF